MPISDKTTKQTTILSENILESVTPRDCALALAIPLSKEQFLEDLKQPSDKDYACHIKRQNYREDYIDEDYWALIYGWAESIISQICNEVEKRGVTVRRCVTLKDFYELTDNFKIVTLVAHWRFLELKPDELIDAEAFIDCLQSPVDTIQYVVRQTLLRRAPHLINKNSFKTFSRKELGEKLVKELNTVIDENYALYNMAKNSDTIQANQDDTELLRVEPLELITRAALEQSFPNLIVAARTIEFSDGLHIISDLIKSISESFTGLLDLTVCNSVIIGKIVKFYHPKCLVAVNRYSTQPHIRMIFYKLVIEQLTRRPAPFIDVLTKLHTGKF
jgi:hypothetical protein